MTRGRPLSDDFRGAILNMARTLDVPSIVKYTGCKKRTIHRVLEDYRKKGTILRKHMTKELRGAKRSLTNADVQVLAIFTAAYLICLTDNSF